MEQQRWAAVKRHRLLQTLARIGKLANAWYVLHVHHEHLKAPAMERYGYRGPQALLYDMRKLIASGWVTMQDCSFRCTAFGRPHTSTAAVYGLTSEGERVAKTSGPPRPSLAGDEDARS